MSMCQSCGMPFVDGRPPFGTNADGTRNADYCESCYAAGRFTDDLTLEEMVRRQTPYVVESNPGFGALQAQDMLHSFLPGLKRWHS